MQNAWLVVFSLLFLATASTVLADKTTVGKYEVSYEWEQKEDIHRNNMFVLHGNVRNGDSCRNLAVTVLLRSPWDEHTLVTLRATVEDYKPQHWNEFRSEQNIRVKEHATQRWIFEDIAVECSP